MNTEHAQLREVRDSDLPHFFEHQSDSIALRMAAFTAPDPADRDAFERQWARIRSDSAVTIRAIEVGGRVAGHVAAFEREGVPEVTYCLGRGFWGQGLATWALVAFLRQFDVRPPYGRAAATTTLPSECWKSAASITLVRTEGSPMLGARRSTK